MLLKRFLLSFSLSHAATFHADDLRSNVVVKSEPKGEFPFLPPLLTLSNGSKVTTKEEWEVQHNVLFFAEQRSRAHSIDKLPPFILISTIVGQRWLYCCRVKCYFCQIGILLVFHSPIPPKDVILGRFPSDTPALVSATLLNTTALPTTRLISPTLLTTYCDQPSCLLPTPKYYPCPLFPQLL